MFRPMQRAKQQLSQQECLEILTREPRGVLSVIGDDGYPYGMPMNHWYDPETGHLCFHCGKKGHRMDALERCDKVCFTVYDQGYRRPGEWALNIKSVIVFGRVRIVEDHARAIEISRRLSLKFTQDEVYIEDEIARSGNAVLCFELICDHITGKQVNEA